MDVWAVHSHCGHIHPGTLLTEYKEGIYVVKFRSPFLGTIKVPEELISADFMKEEGLKEKRQATSSASFISEIDQCDLDAFTVFRSLLDLEGSLLQQLKFYHELAEKRNE